MGMRVRLETVVSNSHHVHIMPGIPVSGTRSSVIGIEKNLNATQDPSGWIPDIGVGKEWDKVVGYWRFSDLLKMGDPGFCNSGFPGARGAITDLSKYGNALEIFGGATKVQCNTVKCAEAVCVSVYRVSNLSVGLSVSLSRHIFPFALPVSSLHSLPPTLPSHSSPSKSPSFTPSFISS
jgi:hypothetical protein